MCANYVPVTRLERLKAHFAAGHLPPFPEETFPAMLAPFVPTAALAIGATCFITFGHGLWVANLQTIPTDIFRGPEIGTVTGFSSSGGAIGGMIAQLGTGYLVTHFSYAPVFLLAGLMHPISAVLTYRLLPDRYFTVKI